jgi:hypothetical protein
MDRTFHHPSPEEGRRELAPARSPRMPGQQGSPGWEGQKGRPGKSECPKLSRKTEEGQKGDEIRRRQGSGAHGRRRHPRERIPEPPITILGAGDRGGWCAGIPPATLKDPGRRCGGGGCPAPSRQGWCEGWSASDEGTATRQGGRANRHNPSN